MKRPEDSGFPRSQLIRYYPALTGLTKKKREEIDRLAKQYLKFVGNALTPTRTVDQIVDMALAKGYTNQPSKNKPFYILGPDDKSCALIRPGKRLPKDEPLQNGLRVIAPHVDSPCFIIKQRPLFFEWDPELKELQLGALWDTYAYGYPQAYQWDNLPVKVIGTGIKDGRWYERSLDGTITGHSAHLDQRDEETELGDAFILENIKVYTGQESREDILKFIKFASEDTFFTTMWYVVPDMKPKMIGNKPGNRHIVAYGNDDKIGTFGSVKALLNTKHNRNTCAVICFDYEESSSFGAGGARGAFLDEILDTIIDATGSYLDRERLLRRSWGISADVDTAPGPNETENNCRIDKRNVPRIGYGVCVFSPTGLDENNNVSLDFKYHIQQLIKRKNIRAQFLGTGETSDNAAGLETVGGFLTNRGMYCIDAGPAVTSSHGIAEGVNSADLFWALELYKGVFEDTKPYRRIHKRRIFR